MTCFIGIQESDWLHPDRHSNWKNLTRLHIHVNRFSNCHLPPELRVRGPAIIDEITDADSQRWGSPQMWHAETLFIKHAQHSAFIDEIGILRGKKQLPNRSKLLPLRPIVKDEGLLRCDSQLKSSSCLPWETKYPVILTRNSQVTKLITKDYHERSGHAGTNYVLTQLSTRYWILAARELEPIQERENECAECKRWRAKPVNPVMAPLPELRARKSLRAFSETSVDIGGPYITKQGQGKTRQRYYLCVFTCLGTQAVHLEVVFSLSTDSLMNGLYRMAARRGMPSEMLSDNGTNFLGARNELEELAALDTQRIHRETAYHKVKWRFNPPAAPHFNGVHESMIKSAKWAIDAILGPADINDEELISAIAGAEGLLNSRPLNLPVSVCRGYNSIDSKLFPARSGWWPVCTWVHRPGGIQSSKKMVQSSRACQHVWQRWMKEWLQSLSSRKKWFRHKADLKFRDVVIAICQDVPWEKWPLGRIIAVHPGADGTVRVADISKSPGNDLEATDGKTVHLWELMIHPERWGGVMCWHRDCLVLRVCFNWLLFVRTMNCHLDYRELLPC